MSGTFVALLRAVFHVLDRFKAPSLALFLLVPLFAAMPTREAHAGGGHWCTAVTIGNDCTSSSAEGACQRQFQDLASPGFSVLLPNVPSHLWFNQGCNWTTSPSPGGGCSVYGATTCTTVAPSSVGRECDDANEYRVSEGICEPWPKPEDPPCDGGKEPTGPNPIIYSTGAKILSARDYVSADGRLTLDRYFRSRIFG